MKKKFRRVHVINVLEMLAHHFGGHCYIKAYDKNDVAVSTSPILVKEDDDGSIAAFIDNYYDEYFPDPERIRTIIAGDIIEPATVHEYKEGRHLCYSKGNYLLAGVRISVFDQCPCAKRRTIKGAKEEAINIACQFSDEVIYTEFFKKQEDIIIK